MIVPLPPWEEFAPKSDEATQLPPWEEFAPKKPATAATPEGSVPTLPPWERAAYAPGIADYVHETGLSVARGIAGSAAIAARGLGAQQPGRAREEIARMEQLQQPLEPGPTGEIPGQIEPGNVNLRDRPQVETDGKIATVHSKSFNFGGQEVLLPTVSEDGRLMTDEEAVKQYRETGQHLGKFRTPAEADAYATQLSKAQGKFYDPSERAAERTRRKYTQPESLERKIAAERPMAETKAAETPLYKAGVAIEQGKYALPKSKGILNPWVEDTAGGLGSVLFNVGTSMIPGVGVPLTVLGTTAQGAGEAADKAIKQGRTEQQISEATQMGGAAGATDLVDALLPRFGTPGKVLGFVRRVGARAVKSALTEGGQEGVQQLMQNAISQGVYDPKQDIMEDVTRSGAVGFIVGLLTGGFLGGHGRHEKEFEHIPATPEDLDLARKTMSGTAPDEHGQMQLDFTQPPPAGGTPAQLAAMRTGRTTVSDAPEPGIPPSAPPGAPVGQPPSGVAPGAPAPAPQPGQQSTIINNAVPSEYVPGQPGPEINPLTGQPTYPSLQENAPPGGVPQVFPGGQLFPQVQSDIGVTRGVPDFQSGYPANENPTQQVAQRIRQAPRSIQAEVLSEPDPVRQREILDTYNAQEHVALIGDVAATRRNILATDPTEGKLPENQTGGLQADYDYATDPHIVPNKTVQTVPRGLGSGPVEVGIAADQGPFILNSLHTATVGDWIQDIHPDPVRGEVNGLVHRLVSDRLRQVVSDVKVHILAEDEFNRVADRPADEPRALAIQMQPTVIDPKTGQMVEDPSHPQFIIVREDLVNNSNTMAHLIFHEATHAATARLLRTDPQSRIQVRSLMVEALQRLDDEESNRVAYAFTNEKEFIAEAFSNPYLQHYLAQMDAPRSLQSRVGLDGPRPTMWQVFAKMVQRILGLSNDTFTMLEATLRVGDRIIDVQARLPGSRVRDEQAPYVMGLRENDAAIRAEDPESQPEAVGQNPEFVGTRDAIIKIFGGKQKVPPVYLSAAGHADKMNSLYKWTAGLDQVTRANSDFKPIVDYEGEVRVMHLEEVQMHDLAVRINKGWSRLGERGDFLSQFIDEMAHMRYRSQAEIQNGIVRYPTTAEFNALAAKHNLDQAALDLFNQINVSIVGDVQQGGVKGGFLGRIERSITDRILETTQDPVLAQKKIDTIRAQVAELRKRPYFPFTNFGRHYVLTYDDSGRIVDFQTVEGRNIQTAKIIQRRLYNTKAKEWKTKYGRAPIRNKDIVVGILPKHVAPMIGIPGVLLEDVSKMMKATPAQIQAAKWLQAAEAANRSPILGSKYQRKFYVPGYGINDVSGYSMDLRRAYARFFFHGAKFYTRTKYLNKLEGIVREAESVTGNKESEVAAYMRDHFEKTIKDAKGDWGWAKGGIFIWTMGYVPAAASQNLSQVPMITFPFLSAKFGAARSTRALAKAMNRTIGVYNTKKPAYVSSFEAKALTYGIQSGRISETQAPELAAMSQNRLLQSTGNKAQKTTHWIMQNSAAMFETAEQFNRRVSFRAALDLAEQNPSAKYIDQAVKLHRTEYEQLIAGTAPGAQGQTYTQAEARAIVAAIDAIEQTQFVYARWARPRFMRGGFTGTLFVFKKYVQSLLFMLGQNPDVAIRFLLVAAFIGGLTNLPFAEEFLGILNVVMTKIFGRDWNTEREVRRYMHNTFGDDGDYADLILHGIARKGFGIPALVDLIGSFATSGSPGRGLASPHYVADPVTGELRPEGFAKTWPLPVLDRSRALGQGHISPFDIGKFLDPGKDINRTIAQQTQNASGAVFSVGFNIYKAWADNTYAWNDRKRYEHAVPRLLGDLNQAWRSYWEGRERIRGGPESGTTVLTYDTRDTEQMMEILAIAAGYTTERQQKRWDFIIQGNEARAYWDQQRQGLLNQMNEAIAGGRQSEIDRVADAIKAFNDKVPEYARGQQVGDKTITKSVEGRTKARERQEAGWPGQKKDEPLYQDIRELYKDTTIDVRRPAGQR